MSDHSSENYLDNLLNSVDGTGMDESEQKIQEEFDKTMGSKTESDFLREFESELEAEVYNEYISEFENELESEPVEQSNLAVEEDLFQMADDDASLDDMLAQMENISADGFVDDVKKTMDTDDPNLGSLEDLDLAVGAFDTVMEESEESALGQDTDPLLSSEGDLELADILGTEIGEEIGESMGEELSDVGLDDLGSFDQISTELEPENIDDKKNGKKGSFLEKLKLIFFGEDDEEDVIDLENVDVSNIEGLSEEEQKILGDLGDKGDAKGKKKEKKKKEPKPKKVKPKKPPKEKKKKEPKPKKVKPPKEKDNTPPLPKGPVFLIWFMAASLGLLVILGTNLTSHSGGIRTAKLLHDTGSYTEAYQEIRGLSIKSDEDKELYYRISTMASVASEYDSYIRYLNYGRKDLALDSLICAAGRCELQKENAAIYGCEEDLKRLKKNVKTALKKKFKMSMSEALELYQIDDRNEYTIELKGKMEKLGIN